MKNRLFFKPFYVGSKFEFNNSIKEVLLCIN